MDRDHRGANRPGVADGPSECGLPKQTRHPGPRRSAGPQHCPQSSHTSIGLPLVADGRRRARRCERPGRSCGCPPRGEPDEAGRAGSVSRRPPGRLREPDAEVPGRRRGRRGGPSAGRNHHRAGFGARGGRGPRPRATAVADCMTRDPCTIATDEVASTAAERMIELGVRHLPRWRKIALWACSPRRTCCTSAVHCRRNCSAVSPRERTPGPLAARRRRRRTRCRRRSSAPQTM